MKNWLCIGVRFLNMFWCQACYCIISDICKSFAFFVHKNNLGNLLLETNAIIIPFSVGEIKEHILLAHIIVIANLLCWTVLPTHTCIE